jgi:hypothetical protein
MIITAVPSEALDIVWGDVKRLLKKSTDISKGKYEVEDVYDSIKIGAFGLWLILDGDKPVSAITTRIIQYPGGSRALAMDWVGGTRMKEWLPLLQETMEKYGRDSQCTHLEGYGRRAWGKWLEKYNWETDYIAYRMELNNE